MYNLDQGPCRYLPTRNSDIAIQRFARSPCSPALPSPRVPLGAVGCGRSRPRVYVCVYPTGARVPDACTPRAEREPKRSLTDDRLSRRSNRRKGYLTGKVSCSINDSGLNVELFISVRWLPGIGRRTRSDSVAFNLEFSKYTFSRSTVAILFLCKSFRGEGKKLHRSFQGTESIESRKKQPHRVAIFPANKARSFRNLSSRTENRAFERLKRPLRASSKQRGRNFDAKLLDMCRDFSRYEKERKISRRRLERRFILEQKRGLTYLVRVV